jgi:hypothetical protein
MVVAIADLPAMGTTPSQFQPRADCSEPHHLHLKTLVCGVFQDSAGGLHCGVRQVDVAKKLPNEEGK